MHCAAINAEKSNRRERGHRTVGEKGNWKVKSKTASDPSVLFLYGLPGHCPNPVPTSHACGFQRTYTKLVQTSYPHPTQMPRRLSARSPILRSRATPLKLGRCLAHLTQQGHCPAQSSLRKVTPSLGQGLKGQFQARLASELPSPSGPDPTPPLALAV